MNIDGPFIAALCIRQITLAVVITATEQKLGRGGKFELSQQSKHAPRRFYFPFCWIFSPTNTKWKQVPEHVAFSRIDRSVNLVPVRLTPSCPLFSFFFGGGWGVGVMAGQRCFQTLIADSKSIYRSDREPNGRIAAATLTRVFGR